MGQHRLKLTADGEQGEVCGDRGGQVIPVHPGPCTLPQPCQALAQICTQVLMSVVCLEPHDIMRQLRRVLCKALLLCLLELASSTKQGDQNNKQS
eukprot:scaffold105659_cov18-Tisochrysis_lutea.AAC.2